MNKIVDFKIAYKLKKLGFNIPVQNKYLKEGILNKNGERRYGEPIDYNNECFQDEGRGYISAPTCAEVIEFLLEKHNVSIELFYYQGSWSFDVWDIDKDINFLHTGMLMSYHDYYIEAFNTATLLTLNKLLKI